ncbi:MAG: hypothetical protein IJX08_07425 [Clostridia bacterium]|nr:hypothetical protein [Clostridia bacterium]
MTKRLVAIVILSILALIGFVYIPLPDPFPIIVDDLAVGAGASGLTLVDIGLIIFTVIKSVQDSQKRNDDKTEKENS